MSLYTVLVIGLTSAALLTCSILLTVAVIVIWCLRRYLHKNEKESTLSVDMVEHIKQQDCVETTGDMIIQQNAAYEKIHEKDEPTPPVDMVVYDVPVFTNRQGCIETTVIQQNVAYEQVQWN